MDLTVDDDGSIFPSLRHRRVPSIETKILLHLNFHTDDLYNLSLVSRGWRNFIQYGMLKKPDVKNKILRGKEFVQVWNRKPVAQKLGEAPHRIFATAILGNYILILDVSEATHSPYVSKTFIYLNLEYFGFISTPGFINTPCFLPCRDFFIHPSDFCCAENQRFKVYSKQDGSGSELLSRELESDVSLQGRKIISKLKRVDDENLILLCIDDLACNLIIINMINEFEKIISISIVGNGRPDFAMDSHDLVVLWKDDCSLQMIDHVKGEEIWVHDNLASYCSIKIKTIRFTCILQHLSLSKSTLSIFDNKSGDLLNSFSARWSSLMGRNIASYGRNSIIFRIPAKPANLCIYNVQTGHLSEVTVMKICFKKSDCFAKICYFLDVIKSRILLVVCRCKCGTSLLVTFDLWDECHTKVIWERQNSSHYEANISRKRILNFKTYEAAATLLYFDHNAQN